MRARDRELNIAYLDRRIWQQVTTPRIGILHELARKLLSELETITGPGGPSRFGEGFKLDDQLEKFEAEVIVHALQLANGSQRKAAQMLGIKNTTLHEKLKRFRLGVVKPRQKERSKV